MIVVFVLVIIAAIAIPDFHRISARACVSEVKSNLRSIYIAQEKYFEFTGSFAAREGDKECFDLLEWAPRCGGEETLYSYYCDSDVHHNKKGDKNCPVPDVPPVTATSFTIYSVGNVDNDPECDVWTINDAKVLKHLVDDY